MDTKFVNFSVLIISFILLLFSIYKLAAHIDYFATRTLSVGTIIHLEQQGNEAKKIMHIQFQNNFNKKIDTQSIQVSDLGRNNISSKGNIEIYYTKYFSQVFITGYKNPRSLIFLIDLLMILIFYFGVRAGISGLKKRKSQAH